MVLSNAYVSIAKAVADRLIKTGELKKFNFSRLNSLVWAFSLMKD
jgi:hypothetical protein